ncbi:hypothetical protein [Devosia sp.]|uniref:hypothetical protein n=1 Tax=Devosia sp. TaxID=1871048 RepID=UPI0032642767
MFLVQGSIDHFHPKSIYPKCAYEWNNLRYCNSKANNTKDNSEFVLDPFSVGDDWFHLLFPSCQVTPNPNLAKIDRYKVRQSIDILHLNSDDDFVQQRSDFCVSYADGDADFDRLQKLSPFVARELLRQGLNTPEKVANIFGRGRGPKPARPDDIN